MQLSPGLQESCTKNFDLHYFSFTYVSLCCFCFQTTDFFRTIYEGNEGMLILVQDGWQQDLSFQECLERFPEAVEAYSCMHAALDIAAANQAAEGEEYRDVDNTKHEQEQNEEEEVLPYQVV